MIEKPHFTCFQVSLKDKPEPRPTLSASGVVEDLDHDGKGAKKKPYVFPTW